MEVYDEAGEKVEGLLTEEEVQAKLDEQKEESANVAAKDLEEIEEEKQKEIDALKLEKEENYKKLKTSEDDGGDDKDKNFKALRENNKKMGERLDTLTSELAKFNSPDAPEKVNAAIAKYSNGDKEVEEKIKLYFNQFAKPTTAEELDDRMQSAAQLAGVLSNADNKLGSSVIGSSSSNNLGFKADKGKMSDEIKELGKQLGLTDKDLANK